MNKHTKKKKLASILVAVHTVGIFEFYSVKQARLFENDVKKKFPELQTAIARKPR